MAILNNIKNVLSEKGANGWQNNYRKILQQYLNGVIIILNLICTHLFVLQICLMLMFMNLFVIQKNSI